MKERHTNRFLELMQREPSCKHPDSEWEWSHTDEEIVYLAKEDLVTFGEKFLSESNYYMYELS
jgi:hypothetical protein